MSDFTCRNTGMMIWYRVPVFRLSSRLLPYHFPDRFTGEQVMTRRRYLGNHGCLFFPAEIHGNCTIVKNYSGTLDMEYEGESMKAVLGLEDGELCHWGGIWH